MEEMEDNITGFYRQIWCARSTVEKCLKLGVIVKDEQGKYWTSWGTEVIPQDFMRVKK
jgi:hypothetical protein